MPKKESVELTQARAAYVAAAKGFEHEAKKAVDVLGGIGRFEMFFKTNDKFHNYTFQLADLVKFLRTLSTHDTIPDFFVFDINAKTKTTPPTKVRDSTIEVTMPQGSHSTRTRKGWSGGRDTGHQVDEPLYNCEIGSVFDMIRSDARAELAAGNEDKNLPKIAACADKIKQALNTTNIAELATQYLELREQHKEASKKGTREHDWSKLEKLIAKAGQMLKL